MNSVFLKDSPSHYLPPVMGLLTHCNDLKPVEMFFVSPQPYVKKMYSYGFFDSF